MWILLHVDLVLALVEHVDLVLALALVLPVKPVILVVQTLDPKDGMLLGVQGPRSGLVCFCQRILIYTGDLSDYVKGDDGVMDLSTFVNFFLTQMKLL